jgi:uncharacterized membrane protein YfcA
MVMDDLNLFSFLIFIAGGFAASVITALAGFAFGVIAAGPWLHVLTPSQTTALIVAYGLLVQGIRYGSCARPSKSVDCFRFCSVAPLAVRSVFSC